MYAQRVVGTTGTLAADVHGVVVGKQLLQASESVLTIVLVFLQTDNVGALASEKVHNAVGALLLSVGFVARIAAYVVTDNLDAAFGRVDTTVEGNIGAYGTIADDECYHGYPGSAPLDDDPKEEQRQVDDDECGKRHTHPAKQGIRHRVQPIAVAHQHHQHGTHYADTREQS